METNLLSLKKHKGDAFLQVTAMMVAIFSTDFILGQNYCNIIFTIIE